MAGDVVDLILKDVLPKQPKANQNDVTTTDPSDECAAKMSAMRLVTTYLLGSEDEELARYRVNHILHFFSSFLSNFLSHTL